MIEYKLLTGVELNAIDPQGLQWPWDTFAVVAFDDGKVVGRLAIRNMPVLEGWWVDPGAEPGIADELADRAEDTLRAVNGATHAACITGDDTPKIRRYVHLRGYKDLPMKIHVKQIVEAKAA